MKNCLLSYSSAAQEWIEGLPLGNGKIGAMVWESGEKQIISLNHERLWKNGIQKEIKTAHLIEHIRNLVLNGSAKEAHNLFVEEIADMPDSTNAYQPFFDLIIESNVNIKSIQNYKRELDIERAVSRISFLDDVITYENTCFVDQQGHVHIRLESGEPTSYVVSIGRQEDEDCSYNIEFSENKLIFKGKIMPNTCFAAVIEIVLDRGDLLWENNALIINNACDVCMKIALSTSFEAENPYEQCINSIADSNSVSYCDAYQTHIKEFSKKFNNFQLNLHGGSGKTTEQLYNDIFDKAEINNDLYEQFLNMARYLMLCSSTKDSLPTNLQGIWNREVRPMWECGYTMDMNIQMDYWLSMPANMGESQMALFNWIGSSMPSMRKQAMDIFGARGIYIPQYTDVFMVPNKCKWAGSFQILWSGAATWIAQHFFEYYKYTNDKEFLLNIAYPYMKECAAFYKDFAIKRNGKYIICPTSSPENMTTDDEWLVNTATMDISLIKELTENLMFISDKFALEELEYEFWKQLNEDIADYPINDDNCMEEWISDKQQKDLGHRHISHIYGIFPGKMFFDKGNEKLKEGAINALYKRRKQGFSSCATWSYAWQTCCFARIGDGNTALSCVDDLMKTGMINNFLTTHNDWRENGETLHMIPFKLFQIEAVLGAAAGICEMFLQSFDKYISILPSLPKKWREGGDIKGICSYGNLTFDICWENGFVSAVKLITHSAGKVNLKINTNAEFALVNNVKTKLDGDILTLEFGENQIIDIIF